MTNIPDDILTAENLRAITGYQNDGDMLNYLRKKCGIVCFNAKNGPWTTIGLVELAGKVKMGLATNDDKKQDWL